MKNFNPCKKVFVQKLIFVQSVFVQNFIFAKVSLRTYLTPNRFCYCLFTNEVKTLVFFKLQKEDLNYLKMFFFSKSKFSFSFSELFWKENCTILIAVANKLLFLLSYKINYVFKSFRKYSVQSFKIKLKNLHLTLV